MAVTRPGFLARLRRRFGWTAAMVLIAMGGAGLAIAADRPATDELRPELTAHADLLAKPWIDGMSARAHETATHVDAVSQAGRNVLSLLAAADPTAVTAALDDGDGARANLELAAGALAALRHAPPVGLAEGRLSQANRQRLAAIDEIVGAAAPVPATWLALADLTRNASSLPGITAPAADHVAALDDARGRVAAALADLP